MIPSGIEPATFRFVAQHLNHCYRGLHHFELWVLFIPSRVKLNSSVNSTNGINRRLTITHRRKPNRLASSPFSRRWTSVDEKDTGRVDVEFAILLYVERRSASKFCVCLLLGYILPTAKCFLLRPHFARWHVQKKYDCWEVHQSHAVCCIANTLESGSLRLGNGRLYSVHAAKAFPLQNR